MSWSVQAVILGCEMVLGYVLGRVFIPYFRRIKTGKFDFYIGDRFAKDGSEPKFGGVVIMLCVIFGIVTGVIFYDSQAVLSFENGEFSRRVFIALGGVLMLTAIGLSEDYVKEKKLGIGMKPFYKICMEYLICLGVCVGLRYCGGVQTAVLMPFHLGYVQFGRRLSLLGVQSCEALFGRVGCAGDWWSYDYGGAAFRRIFRFPAGWCGGGR